MILGFFFSCLLDRCGAKEKKERKGKSQRINEDKAGERQLKNRNGFQNKDKYSGLWI